MVRHSAKIFFEIILGIMTLFVFLFGLAIWWVTQNPLNLAPLKPYLDEAIQEIDLPVDVEIGSLALVWGGWEHRFGLFLGDVKLSQKQPQPQQQHVCYVAQGITIHPHLHNILLGIFAPTKIVLQARNINLIETREGWVIPCEEGPHLALSELFHDQKKTSTHTTMDISQLSTFVISINEINATTSNASLHFELPVFHISQEDKARTRINTFIASAHMFINNQDYVLAETRLNGTMNANYNQFMIEDSLIHFPESGVYIAAIDSYIPLESLTFSGFFDINDLDIQLENVRGSFSKQEFQNKALFDIPIAPQIISFAARYNGKTNELFIENGFFDVKETFSYFSLHGFKPSQSEPFVFDIHAKLFALTVEDLIHLWPVNVGVNPRAWIESNMEGGYLREVEFRTRLNAEDGDISGLYVKAWLDDVNLSFLSEPMPAITDLSAMMILYEDKAKFHILNGQLEAVNITKGLVSLDHFLANKQIAKIDISTEGDWQNYYNLLNNPRLALLEGIDFPLQDIKSDINARLQFEFPMIDGLSMKDVSYKVSTQLKQLDVPKLPLVNRLQSKEAALIVTPHELYAYGEGVLDDSLQASWSYREFFQQKRQVDRKVFLKTTLDTAMQKKWNINLGSFAQGNLPVELLLEEKAGAPLHIKTQVDLTKAEMNIAEINWQKPMNEPGQLHTTLVIKNDQLVRAEDTWLKTNSLEGKATASFNKNLELEHLAFQNVFFANHKDLNGSLRIDPKTGVFLEIQGQFFDAEPYLFNEEEEAAKPPFTPLSISLKAQELRLNSGTPLKHAVVNLQRDQTRIYNLQMSASTGVAPLSLSINHHQNGGKLLLKANDAGGFAKALNISDAIIGGIFIIDGTYLSGDYQSPLQGKATITNYRLKDAPVLTRILSLAAITGFIDLLSGEGVIFDDLNVEFKLDQQQQKLELIEGHTAGPSLGITFAGQVDLKQDQFDIKGTVIPAYFFNALIGSIPLIGDIIVGGKGQGLLATNYTLQGPFKDPQISVNPLSTITPGFLRRIFE